VLGLRPEQQKRALLYGSAMHSAIDVYHETKDLEDATVDFRRNMHDVQSIYDDQEKWTYDYEMGPVVLSVWKSTTDEHNERTIEHEVTHEVPIGPDGIYNMTVRPDWFGKTEDDEYVVRDYKTTHWSAYKTIQQEPLADQLTCYIWAMEKVYPDLKGNIYGQIEALYNRGKEVRVQRSELIYRSPYDISAFEMGLTSIIAETSRRKNALAEGKYPAEFLFPRHGAFCKLFGCEYESICRTNLAGYEKDKTATPLGFLRDQQEDKEDTNGDS
jgi:hypothetical protein